MPGPNSKPQAKDKNGRVVVGKTALVRSNLRSGEGMQRHDYQKVETKPARKKFEKGDD